jgi:hypothetical protein
VVCFDANLILFKVKMTLHIQDPTDPDSDYLIDTLRDACKNATRGAGAFAFLSAGGVQLFFQDEAFKHFGDSGGAFDLIAGVDAITDTKAIAALNVARGITPKLTARVLMPKHPRSIFHPKFAWFQNPDGGVLVTGSGNLTAGGLLWNVEAFSVTKLTKDEVQALADQWDAFTTRCATSLFATDDCRVVKRLEENAKFQASIKAKTPTVKIPAQILPFAESVSSEQSAVDSLPAVTADSGVLVAEISKSGTRWKQANFNQSVFIDFFGASKTTPRTVYFFHVRSDGTLAPQEVRPAVMVASKNYRFELDAAAGLAYPTNGRPIGIFVRLATRTFTYMLLMPSDAGHADMSALLDTKNPLPGKKMRQIVFDATRVNSAWPTSPLWKPLTI